jgi:hypothetical protein
MLFRKLYFIIFLVIVFNNNQVNAEKPLVNKPKWSGGFQLSHDYYTFSGINTNNLNYRRPANLTKLSLYAALSWKKVKLPFEIMLSSQGTNVVTPADQYSQAYSVFSQIKTGRDLVNYLSNPINRVGFSPTIGKFKLLIGTHTPNYSELVQGNISVFGAGFDYKGKNFFTAASYGISQAPIEQNSAQNITGAFRRDQYAFRIGVGNTNKHLFAINFSGARDYYSSVVNKPLFIQPQQGAATSIQFRFLILKNIFWENEMAASLVTQNINDSAINNKNVDLNYSSLFPINISTRADIAGNTAIGYNSKNVKITAKALYVGAGYKSYGFPFFQSDRLELTLNPQISFYKKRYSIGGSIGSRVNNLSGTKLAPMNQLIVTMNLNGQITDNLNLALSYGNFGISNAVLNDTFIVKNVSQNMSITPSYNWQHVKSNDLFIVSYSYDVFQDFNVLSGNTNDNESNIFLASWNRSFETNPFSFGLTYNNFYFKSTFMNLNNHNINLNLGYNFFKGKIKSSFSIGRMLNNLDKYANGNTQWIANLGIDYRNKKGYATGLRWNSNHYNYGSERPNASFSENTLRLSLSKQF